LTAEREKRCQASEGNGFSSAFWRLVDHETDVSGFVAYGFYKFYKFSEIEKKQITRRNDDTLDVFGLNPELAHGFKVRANKFLEEANSNISTAAAVSAQSTQLDDINRHARKKNFWLNVGASATATFLLAVLPISVGLLYPDFRQSVGLWIIDGVASLSMDTPAHAIDRFVGQLDDQERQRYVETMIADTVRQTVDPTFVLNAVIDGFDRHPPKDHIILDHLLDVLKRAEDPQKLAGEIFVREVMPAAAPPSSDP
jgi:hypothetical protein